MSRSYVYYYWKTGTLPTLLDENTQATLTESKTGDPRPSLDIPGARVCTGTEDARPVRTSWTAI